MVLGFVLGFITAYASSAIIVVSWSMRTASASANTSPVSPSTGVEDNADQILLSELRCT